MMPVSLLTSMIATIAASTPDDGDFTWQPSLTLGNNAYGTYGLRIQVTLLAGADATVFDRSTETFTIPESGDVYYVNDGFTTADEYTSAAGSNRATGKLLWQTQLPAGGYATPSTYMVNGKQYVVIAAGGGGKLKTRSGDSFVVFALPDDAK